MALPEDEEKIRAGRERLTWNLPGGEKEMERQGRLGGQTAIQQTAGKRGRQISIPLENERREKRTQATSGSVYYKKGETKAFNI